MAEVGEPGAAMRHKRGGRRTKEAWRKNVDISNVERFLEDQRVEERVGKVLMKSGAELFAADTTGEELPQETCDDGDITQVSTKQGKRAALARTVPRCYRNLLPTSKVSDPNRKRNTVRAPGSRPGALSLLSAAGRARRGVAERLAQERDAARDRERRQRARRRAHRGRFDGDVWEEELVEKRVETSLKSEWLEEARPHLVPPARRVPRPAPAPPLRHTPPALPAPHPGQSYNPSYQEHQDLLRQVCEKEALLIKKEKHLQRVTSALYKHVRPEQAQSQWVREMMSGLPETPSLAPAPAAAADSDESDSEYAAVNPPVRNKKKDARARRKQREQRDLLHDRQRRKIDKKKIADIYKLRFLERALETTEARLARARAVRLARRTARRAAAPPALNAHKHKLHEEDFLQPHELAPALRAHTHTGNLLRDRFESLQRRGVLAPSRIFLRKKLRLKRYWKPGHKVGAKDVQRYTSAAAAATPAAAADPAARRRRQ